jgi:hypothetical protein
MGPDADETIPQLQAPREAPMAVVAVFQGPTLTQEQYEQAVSRLTNGAKRRMEAASDWPVAGVVTHVAGQGPNGFRIADVWESEESFRQFGAVSGPIMQELGNDVVPEVYPTYAFVTA